MFYIFIFILCVDVFLLNKIIFLNQFLDQFEYKYIKIK